MGTDNRIRSSYKNRKPFHKRKDFFFEPGSSEKKENIIFFFEKLLKAIQIYTRIQIFLFFIASCQKKEKRSVRSYFCYESAFMLFRTVQSPLLVGSFSHER